VTLGEPAGAEGVKPPTMTRLAQGLERDGLVMRQSDPDDARVRALEKAGQPVVTLTLRDKLDLGGEFRRWEIATAIAGSLLGIDAFDQPNVQGSKDNTRKVLAGYQRSGKLPAAATVAAPLWVLERGVCAWIALGLRAVRGGVPYAGSTIRRAATPISTLRRRAA